MHTIYKTTSFESAHLLEGHSKCGKLHGHSYKAEVWIGSEETQPPHQFVIDFQEISSYFKQFDHSDEVITISCEMMATEAALYFVAQLESYIQVKVRIWETATSYAEYEVHNV